MFNKKRIQELEYKIQELEAKIINIERDGKILVDVNKNSVWPVFFYEKTNDVLLSLLRHLGLSLDIVKSNKQIKFKAVVDKKKSSNS